MTSNGVVTINVVAINGAQSFSPNPATLPAGQMVVWHNVNNTTHRVVLNDRIGGHRQSRARGVESADGDRRGRRTVSLFDSSGDDRQPQSRHRAVFAHAGLLDRKS